MEPSLINLDGHQNMLTDVRDREDLARRFETNLCVESDRLLPRITPQKHALIAFDHRESSSQEGRRETLTLKLRQRGHATQAVLILLRKNIIPLEVEGGDADELMIDEGPEMERELIGVTLEDAILHCPVRTQDFMSDDMGVYGFNS